MFRFIGFVTFINILLLAYLPHAIGCLYNVRDVGFVDITSSPYHAYYYVRDDTPDKHLSIIKQISYAALNESNIEYEIINIEEQGNHPAMEYHDFWQIKSTPATILVSPQGRSLALPMTEADEDFDKSIWSVAESAVTSGVREQILDRLITSFAIVLFIEGKNVSENQKALKEINDAIEEIRKIMSQLPKQIDSPPHLITIPQKYFVQEKVLIWSLDIISGEGDEPHAVILYGRGRQMGPVLKGSQIARKEVYSTLSIIGLSCECGLDRTLIFGRLIPLRWDKEMQSEVVKKLGFDAENPMIKMEMSAIISSGSPLSPDNETNMNKRSNAYAEGTLQHQEITSPRRISPAKFQALASPKPGTYSLSSPQKSNDIINDSPGKDSKSSIQINTPNKSDDTHAEISKTRTDTSYVAQQTPRSIESENSGSVIKSSIFIVGIVAAIVLAGAISILFQNRRQ